MSKYIDCCPPTCPNAKCRGTGSCVDDLPVVEAPNLVPQPLVTFEKHCLVYCGERCNCQAGKPIGGPNTFFHGEATWPTDPMGIDAEGNLRVGEYIADYSAPATPRTIIAFTGLAGSGKSTAALHLVNSHGFKRIRFAGPLKDMMRALGLSEAEIEGDRKEKPCELLGGKTPRFAMQTIGTEWGRGIIAPDLWIRAFNAALAKVPAGVPVVVDDCRFPNEADAIVAAGGVLVRVVRPGAGAGAAGHSSEAHQLSVVETIPNSVSMEVFLFSVDTLLADLSWRDNAHQGDAV